MTNTNVTNLRKNLFDCINQAVEFNDVISVTSENGNAIILSESDYNGLLETLYLSSDSRVRQDILEGMNSSPDECISEDDIQW